MTLDQIIAELKSAELPPQAALRAAVPHAAALAPDIYRILATFCRGVCLQPADEKLLLHGLHVLAAARHDGLYAKLVDLARVPGDELTDLFLDNTDTGLTRLMLSVWDGDADALLALIEHADLAEIARWAMIDVLTRLTFDGRIPRARTAAFLKRFERDGLADDDSEIWWGWELAVTRLGLVELEPAIRRVWTKAVNADFDADANQESLEQLHGCAVAPHDACVFEEANLEPIVDPVEALEWVADCHAVQEEMRVEMGLTEPNPLVDDDPGRSVRPSAAEMTWLDRFLTSRQVPPTTMSLEMIDGYLTALAIGPTELPLLQHLPLVWGETGEQPAWDGEEQADCVIGLLVQQSNAITVRRNADAPHLPFIMHFNDDEFGCEWSEGFLLGLDLQAQEWQRLLDDRRGNEDMLTIVALSKDASGLLDRTATPAERDGIIERLPYILQRIAAYWRNPSGGYARQQPIRVAKVGRNDPCPCGSGKKYKKCCALAPPSTLH